MNMLLFLMANFVYILADEKETSSGLIPDDIICPFCIAVIEKFQQTTQQNSTYREFLCESISAKNRKNYNSCIKSLNEMTLEKLKVSSAEELCKNQKICPINYKKPILIANASRIDFPPIPLVTDEQLKNAEKHNALKTITDILTGKVENSNKANLTFHIDVQFQKLQPSALSTAENSTTISNSMETNRANF